MKPLTFCVEQTSGSVALPTAAFSLCGFHDTADFELRTGDGMLVVLKRKMTAMDLVNVVDGLHQLSTFFSAYLSEVCGECGECDQCLYDGPEPDELDISDGLREAAGLPLKHKICVEADKENHRLIISDSGYDHDLRDVPDYLKDMFIEGGAALCDLDQHLRLGDIIYGGD